jgi:hypothetical protein
VWYESSHTIYFLMQPSYSFLSFFFPSPAHLLDMQGNHGHLLDHCHHVAEVGNCRKSHGRGSAKQEPPSPITEPVSVHPSSVPTQPHCVSLGNSNMNLGTSTAARIMATAADVFRSSSPPPHSLHLRRFRPHCQPWQSLRWSLYHAHPGAGPLVLRYAVVIPPRCSVQRYSLQAVACYSLLRLMMMMMGTP